MTTQRAVLNLRESRRVWSAPDEVLARIASAFPRDWVVEMVRARGDGRGDGGAVPPQAVAAARDAEVYIGNGVPVEILRAAGPSLRWAHTATAGVRSLLYPEMLAADLVLTNSAGIHAEPIADTVFAMLLHFARGLDFAVRAQAALRWNSTPFEDADDGTIRELAGSVLGIVGLGGIGRAVAKRGVALGMHVIASRRSDAAGPDGVELLRGDDALDTLVARSDFVVLTLPSTPSTHHALDDRRLRLLRRNTVLINVSRGDVLDEQALIRALTEQRIRGAALDVFQNEPLPPDSLLWKLPNVLILPHVSGTSTRFWEREQALILDNIARYLAGDPLRNEVNRRAGY